MRMFFSCGNIRDIKWVSDNGVKNILWSYAYLKNCDGLEFLREKNLLIDSGAFTLWTKGRQVDLDEYIEYVKKEVSKLKFNKVDIINLDVIPGKFGKKPEKEEIEHSAEQGMKNYLYMKSKGVKTIHTFHQHEDFKWLERVMKTSDYIGISPANDVSLKSRINWLNKVYSIVQNKCRTHILGLTSIKALESFPCYSADSIKWTTGQIWGHAIGVKNKSRLSVYITRSSVETARKHNTMAILKEEEYITKLWEQRGVVWS